MNPNYVGGPEVAYMTGEDPFDAVKRRWQFMIDLLAQMAAMPYAMINRIEMNELTVLILNDGAEGLGAGMCWDMALNTYCKTVMGTNQTLLVQDAKLTERWDDCPAAMFGLISYYGLPIRDASGEMFGTICVMDSQPSNPDENTKRLISVLRDAVEQDLRLGHAHRALVTSEAAMREALAAAETATRAKSEFLARMSHEIRTPLTAILGFSELMHSDKNLSADQCRYLNLIRSSGDHLLNLVNDVLDMERIEAGRHRLEVAPLALERMLQNVVAMMRERAESKSLHLQLELADDLPQYILSDEGKLRQVLLNLLGNAIKFTEEGFVKLRATILTEDSGPRLKLEVEDSGCGIAPADQAKVFDPFEQVNTRGKQTGTGLGLTIVQQFALLLGGEVALRSAKGKGSTFQVSLPVLLTQDAAPHANATSSIDRILGITPGYGAPRILVVDDQTESTLLARHLLEKVGFKVEVAEDGIAGISVFKQWKPHLIFMDWRMPSLDGAQACQEIRRLPGGDQVPIVGLTASVMQGEADLLVEAGMDDFLPKPYRAEHLYECLGRHLGLTYIYSPPEDLAEQKPPRPLAPEMFKILPERICKELEQNLLCLDEGGLSTLLESISIEHPELTKIMVTMIDNNSHAAILQTLRRGMLLRSLNAVRQSSVEDNESGNSKP